MGVNRMAAATYLYCIVAAPRTPSLRRVPRGLPGTGPVRLVDLPSPRGGRWLVVADAPLARYGEKVLNARLADLAWVSRAAIAHEAVVEAFIGAPAVVPMKLFTMFATDERARSQVAADPSRLDRVLKRVGGHREWGVRVTLNRAKAAPAPLPRGRASGGAGYLAQKKAHRDATAESSRQAKQAASALFEGLAPLASDARRRGTAELPAGGGPLLLDAVFLVRATGEKRFARAVETRARTLAAAGCEVVLSGPWPPYGFVGD